VGAAGLLSGHGEAWSIANPGNAAARRELRDAILAAAGPQLRGSGALLDCGCGTGWLLEALAGAGVEAERLYGIDFDPRRVEAAARRVPAAEVAHGDACELPFPNGSFAAVFHVVSLSSVGGTSSVRAALREACRVLAADGLLLVYEPRLPNPLNHRTRRLRDADLAAAGMTIADSTSLTLLPPLGRRLGRFTPALHPWLSRLRPLRSHRLLALRRQGASVPPGARSAAARRSVRPPPR
jgi:ubiquinone/menaquinone biosynthesis C-methylase UbiE